MSEGFRFTYGNDPSASPVDAVRFLVGDTNPMRPLLDDREVAWAIAKEPNENLAAALLADSLFGKFASQADITVGPVSKSYSKVAELFKSKADQLRGEACKFAVASFPATRVSTKLPLAQNIDLTSPSFAVGQSDNPFALQINEGMDGARFYGFNY